MTERPTAPGDWELVQRVRAGDHEAYRVLVERYQRRIAALALGMLHSEEDALDIVQETFTRAYQHLDRFKGEAAFYTWIYRIAYNLCVDQQRRSGQHPEVPITTDERGDEAPLALPDGPAADEPFDRLRDNEIGDRLRHAMRELTPDHQAVILLREVEGLSYAEISQVLECPKGTVMSRLHYARRRLQARLRGLL